jgi:SAM-dependent methyltransferase
MTTGDNITGHYGGDGEIARRIDEQLRLSGVADDHNLSPSDLAALDQFHVGGLAATQELARLFSPSRGSYVLDIGSGLGGPSRYLAANYGCRVIGIDITEEYCRIASVLAARMGLEDRVEYRHGDPRVLLFPDETFDGAWTQHVSMNIAEKKQLYEGARRILKAVCTSRCRPAHARTHSISGALGPYARDQSSSVDGSHEQNDPGGGICPRCVE